MKISSIHINNITSFVNEHFINFNELIGDDSLFAITGPTGSGKSSIITAISLALYGKGHKKNLNSSDYVSQGSISGNIRLDFQINGKEYTATWRCKVKKKDGTLIKTPVPKRELFSGNVAIDSSIEEILGLSYDHFCKTTILNQGEFAKFITSSFKDRKDILESMHDNIYLSSISTDLNKQIKVLKEKIKYSTDLEQNSHPYSAKEKININENVKSSQIKISIASPIFEVINEIYRITDDITKIQKNFTNNEKKISTLTKEVTIIREQFNKSSTNLNIKTKEITLFNSTFTTKNKSLNNAIKDHETVNLRIENLNEQKKLIEKTNQDISESKKLVSSASKKLKEVNIKLDNNFSKLTIYKDNINNLELINEHINSIDTLSSNVKIHSKSIKEIKIEISKDLSEVEKNKILIIKMNNSYNQILKTYNLNSSMGNLENLKNELEAMKKNTHNRERQIRDAKINLNRSESELGRLNDQANSTTKEHLEISNGLSLLQTKITESIDRRDTLALKHSEQKRIQSISDLSSEGIIKQECPVCLQKWPDKIVQTKYKDVGNDEHKDIEELNIVIKSSEDKLLITNQELKQLSNQIKTIGHSIANLNNEINNIFTRLNINNSSTFSVDDLDKEISSCSDNYNKISNDQSKLISIVEKINASKLAEEKLTSIITSNQLKLKELLQENDNGQARINEEINLISKLAPEYGDDQKNIPIFYKNDTLTKSSIIKSEKIKQKAELELGYLSKKIIELNSHANESQEQVPKLIREIDLLKLKIKKISPTLSPLDDLNKLQQEKDRGTNHLSELKQQYFHLKAQQDICENNLSIAKAQKDDLQLLLSLEFSKISKLNIERLDYCKDLSLPGDGSKILNDAIKSIKEFASVNTSDITFEQLKIIDLLNNNLILSSKNIIEDFLSYEKKELTESTTKLEIISQKDKELRSLRDKIKNENKMLLRLETLDNILGKNEFRNFALSLIEQRLIDQANIELRSLCDDRYTIKQKHGTHGPEYFIDDKWNADGIRKISTLSGGETFLIGLSMALSLAEFSRGYTQLDFFFIDEGFGTLDDQSLEEVLNVLLSLNSRGKQIGIISHITKLTDQIPINLTLTKNGLGESIIKNYYN